MSNLEQYKKGEMTAEELESFTDSFMRAKYDNDRKNRWENKLSTEQGINQTAPEAKSRRLYLWVAVAAAVLLLLLAYKPIIQSFNSPGYEQLAEAFITDNFYENLEISRADQDITQVNLDAIAAYNQKNFETAITHFETIVAQGIATDKQFFFLGLSHLYSQEYDDAIANFIEAKNVNDKSKFKQDIQWFLSLAYLKNEDLVNGKSALLSISKGQWNYDKAQQLLEAI